MSASSMVYKICTQSDWADARRSGHYAGSGDDLRDGFIHLSTRDQLAGTAAKHFRGLRDLVIVAFDADGLGPALRWEPSRGGALFPHLYARLDVAAAVAVHALPLGPDGVPVIPAELGS